MTIITVEVISNLFLLQKTLYISVFISVGSIVSLGGIVWKCFLRHFPLKNFYRTVFEILFIKISYLIHWEREPRTTLLADK